MEAMKIWNGKKLAFQKLNSIEVLEWLEISIIRLFAGVSILNIFIWLRYYIGLYLDNFVKKKFFIELIFS